MKKLASEKNEKLACEFSKSLHVPYIAIQRAPGSSLHKRQSAELAERNQGDVRPGDLWAPTATAPSFPPPLEGGESSVGVRTVSG